MGSELQTVVLLNKIVRAGKTPVSTCVRASWVIGARGRWEWSSGTQSVTQTAPPVGLDDNSRPLMLQRGKRQACRYIFT